MQFCLSIEEKEHYYISCKNTWVHFLNYIIHSPMNFIFGVENNIAKQSFYLSQPSSQEADISGGLKSLPHLWLIFILVIKYPVSRGPSLQHKIIGLHPRVATLNSAVLPLLGGWAVVRVNWTYCAHICVFRKQLSQHLWVANVWGEASQDNLLFKKCYTFTTWKKEKRKQPPSSAKTHTK